MSKIYNLALPAVLILSALVFSACASKPSEQPIVAPAILEAPAAPVVAPEPAPLPTVAAKQPTPKPKVRKPNKMIAKATPTVVVPPVEVPAPVMQPEPPIVQPLPPVVVEPMEMAPEPGILEQYWVWLLALGLAIAGIVLWRTMNKRAEH